MKDREYLRSSLRLLFQRFGMVNLIAAAKYLHAMDGDFRRAAADYDEDYETWPAGARNHADELSGEINHLQDKLEENGVYEHGAEVSPTTESCRRAFKLLLQRFGLNKCRDAERHLYDTDGDFRNLCDTSNDPDTWPKAAKSRIEDLERQLESRNKRCDELETQNDELESSLKKSDDEAERAVSLAERVEYLQNKLQTIMEVAENATD